MKTPGILLTGLLVVLVLGSLSAQEAKPAATPAATEAVPKKADTPAVKTPEPTTPEVAPASFKATVISTKGAAEYREGPGKPWQKIAVGQELTGNAEVSTGLTGEVVLELDTDAEVTVRRLTQMSITQLRKTDQANITEVNINSANSE